jgi:hypothetical protein
MSRAERTPAEDHDDGESHAYSGPNLKLIYSLIVLAMVVAIAVAAVIILPFYLRR